eukprot:CAMPEP_0195528342 /NCGR_PEP_ID=MMETSP0794_2-20130614/30438_1 /TAXON_ID=515487 /ORGANISM="Stephanopyxis turris, Strain CCMP 815" /LENGTH=295 /DNA_ID=CAMNT_0040659465 /DNA_START=202 /DNA_END=1089 /DNA_ORIENTATION=-
MQTYKLLQKWQKSPNSWMLRFSLPLGQTYLHPDPMMPTCISVQYNNGTDEISGNPKPLKKSYSPISHPNTKHTVDLLVKAYPPRNGGGVGAYLCSLNVGESIQSKLKPPRLMHGSPYVSNHRWDEVGLVAAGTGVAPLLQIVRILLDPKEDSKTRVKLLCIHRYEEDILMKEEIDALAKEHEGRFMVTYSLTGGEQHWTGLTGRGSVEMARKALPPPSSLHNNIHENDADMDEKKGDAAKTMILVCGPDGFVDTWAGPVGRAPPKADGTKGAKIQGPLLGILKEAGYDASEVFKY